jgi:hypothetical protein
MRRTMAESALVALTMFWLTGPLPAAQAPDNTPIGYWKTIDDHTGQARSIVRIFEANGELHGRIEKFLNLPNGVKPPTCDKCPGDKQGKPVLGLEFLWDSSETAQVGVMVRCSIRKWAASTMRISMCSTEVGS